MFNKLKQFVALYARTLSPLPLQQCAAARSRTARLALRRVTRIVRRVRRVVVRQYKSRHTPTLQLYKTQDKMCSCMSKRYGKRQNITLIDKISVNLRIVTICINYDNDVTSTISF